MLGHGHLATFPLEDELFVDVVLACADVGDVSPHGRTEVVPEQPALDLVLERHERAIDLDHLLVEGAANHRLGPGEPLFMDAPEGDLNAEERVRVGPKHRGDAGVAPEPAHVVVCDLAQTHLTKLLSCSSDCVFGVEGLTPQLRPPSCEPPELVSHARTRAVDQNDGGSTTDRHLLLEQLHRHSAIASRKKHAHACQPQPDPERIPLELLLDRSLVRSLEDRPPSLCEPDHSDRTRVRDSADRGTLKRCVGHLTRIHLVLDVECPAERLQRVGPEHRDVPKPVDLTWTHELTDPADRTTDQPLNGGDHRPEDDHQESKEPSKQRVAQPHGQHLVLNVHGFTPRMRRNRFALFSHRRRCSAAVVPNKEAAVNAVFSKNENYIKRTLLAILQHSNNIVTDNRC